MKLYQDVTLKNDTDGVKAHTLGYIIYDHGNNVFTAEFVNDNMEWVGIVTGDASLFEEI